MAEFYDYVDAEPVTIFVPPDSSRRGMQVKGVEPHSGIYFLSVMNRKAYLDAGFRNVHMNALGKLLYEESLTPGVVGISVRQVQDAQNQLRNQLDVTVQSTSGNSSDRITLPYPRVGHGDVDVPAFKDAVAAEVRLLDAAENSDATAQTSTLARDFSVITAAAQQAATGLAGDLTADLTSIVADASDAGELTPPDLTG